ncbi:MAG TPA: DUF349 domain-containing protein [Acidobacteriota bacterium]|nr:DUF349 domain-containing protein [Acidobacteriota bacterium]
MLKDLFNKPKWQHRDPSVRREVIAELSDQELEEALSELLEDPEAQVRIAALERARSLETLHRLCREDEEDEEEVREAAGQRLRQLLRDPSEDALPLSQRIDFLKGLDDQGLIEDLLSTAPHSELRRALLEMGPRQKAVADMAVDDTDHDLRLLALQRLEEEALLARVMRDTRRHDKRIHREARAKLQQKRLQRGDPKAVRRRREELCQQAEKLAWTVDADRDAKSLEVIVEEWKSLPVAAEEELQERFDAICHRGLNRDEAVDSAKESADQAQEPPEPAPTGEADEGETAEAAAPSQQKAGAQAVIERAERLARDKKAGLQQRLLTRLKESWQTARREEEVSEEETRQFKTALSQLEQLLAEQSKRNEEILSEIRSHLGQVEQHLGQGELREARLLFRKCSRRFKGLPGLTRKQRDTMRSRLKAVHAGVRELKDWHHWGNNQQRLRLIESMEALAGSELHPEELNKRIKAARNQWMRLEQSEKLPDDPPHYASGPGLWRRFHAACNRAYEPCKQFFKERAEKRKAKTAELEAVCRRLEADPELSGDPPDWKPLDRLIREGARSLRRLNEIEPKKRGPMARRIRKALKGLDRRLRELQKPHEEAKKQLIEAAKAQIEAEDIGQATAEIRRLQQQWKETGTTARPREQALWKDFRAACNAVFERFKAKRKEEEQAQQQHNRELMQICAEIEKLCKLEGEQLVKAEEEFEKARQSWAEAESRSPGLERRFVRCCGRFSGKLKAIRRDQAKERRRRQAEERMQSLRRKGDLCAELEAVQGLSAAKAKKMVESAQAQWEELPELSKEDEQRMRRRFDQACQALLEGRSQDWDETAAKHLREADLLCVRMEMLAGIDSPPESAEVRMRYQVSRLSSALVDREKPANPKSEAEEIEHDLCFLGPLPDEKAEGIQKRFLQALESFRKKG